MIRRTAACLLTLGLVACATQPKAPPPPPQASSHPHHARPAPAADGTRLAGTPAETSVEAVKDAPADLAPVPFEEARATFVRETAARFGIAPTEIERVLAQAVFRDDVVKLMAKPAERTIAWNEYRARMLTAGRISGGQAFLAQHRAELERVEQRTGVPPQIVVAIIGVETNYGSFTGKHRVLDALYTLAFRYPRSGDPARLAYEVKRELFFRDELAQLFALAREQKLDLLTLTGSYAGAMGMGQFMPSSYRQFGVDGDGDGRINLLTDYDDIFSSIAHYFVAKGGDWGWTRGGPVAVQATLAPGREEFNPVDWTPSWTLPELAARGYTAQAPVPPELTATPVSLQVEDGRQYWLGFRNYYAITRYNNSKMYAMAVWQLSQAITGQELPPA